MYETHHLWLLESAARSLDCLGGSVHHRHGDDVMNSEGGSRPILCDMRREIAKIGYV
jgi:hypothetical protein